MCTKKKFLKKEAEAAIKKAQKFRRAFKWRREKRFYYCEVCNAWHLTSKEDNEQTELDLIEKERWENLLKEKN